MEIILKKSAHKIDLHCLIVLKKVFIKKNYRIVSQYDIKGFWIRIFTLDNP